MEIKLLAIIIIIIIRYYNVLHNFMNGFDWLSYLF